jgi:hypothetical protein
MYTSHGKEKGGKVSLYAAFYSASTKICKAEACDGRVSAAS